MDPMPSPPMSRRPGPDVFAEAIRRGDYPSGFVHSDEARRFVLEVLLPRARSAREPARILECGCGNGGWLALLAESLPDAREVDLYGFDITPEMVSLARERLRGLVPPDQIGLGDVLDDGAYDFGAHGQKFSVVYAYDVVQQLPRSLQMAACETMARRVAPGGSLVIFDQERHCLHGVNMGFKKLVTRTLGIPLVPRFYCAARYPSLRSLARKLAAGGRAVEIRTSPSTHKRALVVR